MNALVAQPLTNADVYRASTDAAGLCRDIVMKTAMTIQNRQYVRVEGWQAIAIAHGCTGSARDVERVDGGVRAMGEIRRMSDGALIATAEGFVGEDEATWYGGEIVAYGKKKTLPKRPDYAIRAMAQTRAISRACRSAFAHVVVLIDANLSTTPAEEVPMGGFDNDHGGEPRNITPTNTPRANEAKEPDASVSMSKASIDKCNTVDEIKAWWPDNQRVLDIMSDPDFMEVKDHYQARWDFLAKARAPQASATSDFRAEELEGAL